MQLQLSISDSDNISKYVSIKSPIHYPGGKYYARAVLSNYIPMGTKEIVSPFFGGGNLELYLTVKRGIKVNGFDKFEPLVNFWQVLLNEPEELYKIIDYIFNNSTKEDLVKLKTGGYMNLTEPVERAAAFYLLQMLSHNAVGFRNKSITNYAVVDGKIIHASKKAWGALFDHEKQIKNFHNDFISVELMSFEESLTKYDSMYAYCDPPYPEVGGMYGDSKEFHENFNHKLLKEVLDCRTGDWGLSYNNSKTIRKLYPDNKYDISFPDWKQGSRNGDRGNEVFIRPK